MKWIATCLVFVFLLLIWLTLFPEKQLTPKAKKTTSQLFKKTDVFPKQLDVPAASKEAEVLRAEAHFKRVLEVQIAADKAHGKFSSEAHSLKQFQKNCDDFPPLRGLQLFYCELMLTDYDFGETLSQLLAQYRYTPSEDEKIQVHLRIMETYAQLKKFAVRDDYLDCSSGEVLTQNLQDGDSFEISFDSLRADEEFGKHSFDAGHGQESLSILKGQIAEKAKLGRRAIKGVMVMTNIDRDEIQYCAYQYQPTN